MSSTANFCNSSKTFDSFNPGKRGLNFLKLTLKNKTKLIIEHNKF